MSYILLTWLLAPFWWPISQFRKWRQPGPQRVLVAVMAGIGDVICSRSTLAALRQRFPQAHIALLVDNVVADLARQWSTVNEVISFPRRTQRGLQGRLILLHLCRRFDTFICLNPSAAQLTAACWAATPRRLSVLPDTPPRSYRWLSPLLSQALAHTRGSRFVGTQLALLKPLGVADDNLIPPPLPVSAAARQAVQALLPDIEVRWIGLAVGCGQGIKAMQPSVLQAVTNNLLAQPDLGVVLIGGEKEAALAAKLMQAINAPDHARLVNAANQLALADLPGLLARLAVFIGVDSGVTYMADALNVPLVYLPGPVGTADQSPLRAPKIKLQVALPCAPCSRIFATPRHCVVGHHRCVDHFTASDIVAAAQALLVSSASPSASSNRNNPCE